MSNAINIVNHNESPLKNSQIFESPDYHDSNEMRVSQKEINKNNKVI
jgi:hypothetical protein